jgi:hypothetical protein
MALVQPCIIGCHQAKYYGKYIIDVICHDIHHTYTKYIDIYTRVNWSSTHTGLDTGYLAR